MNTQEYQGSARQFEYIAEKDIQVPMRDGTLLSQDVYRPSLKGIAIEGKWPVIVERTPYDKSQSKYSICGRYFAQRGYVFIVQDVRGRAASDGKFEFLRNEANDGFDTIAWISEQSWCGEKISTLGISYSTATQQALAVRNPPKLTTQILLDGAYNYHSQTMRHGGACEYAIAFQYVVRMARTSKEAQDSPRVRDQLDKMWKDLPRWMINLPVKKGETPLRLLPDYDQWFFDMLTKSDYCDYWKTPDLAIDEYYDDYPDIPLLLETSWYGHHITATLAKYTELKKRHKTPKRLVIGTWLHGGEMFTQTFAGDVDFGADAAQPDNFSMQLRWLDQYVKGLNTGIEDEPPVRLFVMGGGSGKRNAAGRLVHGGRWRDELEWPLARARNTPFFLHPDGSLREDRASRDTPPSRYDFDPANPVPTVGGNFTNYGTSGFLEGGGFDQQSGTMSGDKSPRLPLAVRRDVLVFRTLPLEEGVEVTGVVTCKLWVSSSAVDTDFTVKLIDEYPPNDDYPDGYALNLGDSILRMRYLESREQAKLMVPGETYEIEIKLQATSNWFAPGHRIRLDVSSSNFPHYDTNPNTGEPLGLNRSEVVAHQTVYHDHVRCSQIELPLIPTTGETQPGACP
ncbi:CocE/NonD family hydrolase [Burkholderia cepacia]|uniref:CocE/NonD family hydrolase n=1 Tax=Burkholderia cepacia TaxID=292 RepID=UPI001F36ACDA|nr:CocE/NonD family hydrolase [Burkholderia cepacia]MCE4124405.1 CocE/NonD family hydrolase [Burkholderia cepacia]